MWLINELIKFLTSRVGLTATVILGFGIPGNMFIFVWNKEMYMEMNIVKLIFLSFGITFMIFVPNMIIILSSMRLIDIMLKHDFSIELCFAIPITLTFIEMLAAMLAKILNNKYSIKDFVTEIGPPLFWTCVILEIIDTIISVIFRVKKKRS